MLASSSCAVLGSHHPHRCPYSDPEEPPVDRSIINGYETTELLPSVQPYVLEDIFDGDEGLKLGGNLLPDASAKHRSVSLKAENE